MWKDARVWRMFKLLRNGRSGAIKAQRFLLFNSLKIAKHMASERGEPINPIVPEAQEPVEVKDSPAAADSAEAQQGGKKKCKCKKVKPTKGCIIRIFIGLILLGFIIYLIVDFNRVRQGFVDFI